MDLKVGDEVLVRVKIAFIKNDMVGVHYPGKIHEKWVAVAIPKSDIISVEQKWCEHIKDALGNCIKCGLLIKEQRCECKETIKQSGDNRCQYCGLPIREKTSEDCLKDPAEHDTMTMTSIVEHLFVPLWKAKVNEIIKVVNKMRAK